MIFLNEYTNIKISFLITITLKIYQIKLNIIKKFFYGQKIVSRKCNVSLFDDVFTSVNKSYTKNR